uniref:Envelope protein n=1 Tax=Hucho hucho TaxID=62062 RepID=A0A4W5L5S3_9TELE
EEGESQMLTIEPCMIWAWRNGARRIGDICPYVSKGCNALMPYARQRPTYLCNGEWCPYWDYMITNVGQRGSWADTMGMFTIKVLLPSPTTVLNPIQVINIKDFSDSDQLAMETGIARKENMWLAYMRYTARTLSQRDCIICGTGRSELATHPFTLAKGDGQTCVLQGFYPIQPNSTLCRKLRNVFVSEAPTRAPEGVKAYGGNYSCIVASGGGHDYGLLPSSDCGIETNLTDLIGEGVNQTRGVADVWWICGPKRRLTPILKGDWKGRCALASLIMPITLVEVTAEQLLGNAKDMGEDFMLHRNRREAPWTAESTHDVHFNMLGVPAGVPLEFQALSRDDGFWHLLPIIGPAIDAAKQRSMINYIYYNQQRFVNYTRTALTGMAEQLEATSRVDRQNCLALDMMLENQGGVCKMFGEQCCTFIPNNTSPDGSIAKALRGLDRLSVEMKGMAGVQDGVWGWLQGWFGQYVGMVVTGFLTLIIACMFMMCCITFFFSCLKKSVSSTYMMPLLGEDEEGEESFQGEMDAMAYEEPE